MINRVICKSSGACTLTLDENRYDEITIQQHTVKIVLYAH